jgi:hypothetical protein
MVRTTIRSVIEAHAKYILLTFEVFWILIFMLERLGGQTESGIPQFIYVNF